MIGKSAGKEAKLSFTGHLLMENRNGLVVATRLTPATGTAEREAAIAMLNEVPGHERITVAPTRHTTRRTSSPNFVR